MTGSGRSSEGLDLRRRKLLFRAWHRGMREMDLIMGRFADSVIDTLNERELEEFKRLIEMPDREVLAWITGECEVPQAMNSVLLRQLLQFHSEGRGAAKDRA